MTFAYHARYILLTYPQSEGLDAWRVLDHISNLEAECIICREDHADGGTHLHVFLDFGRTRRGRRQDQFDVDGFHPNIAPSRGKPHLGWDYATKDGDVIAGGLERPLERGVGSLESKWAQIVSAGTRDEFFELVRELDPRALVCNHVNIVKYADNAYRVDPEPYSTPASIQMVPGALANLTGWASDNLDTGLAGR